MVGPIVIANNAVYSEASNAISLISGNTALVTVAGNVGHGGLSGASTGYVEGGSVTSDFVNAHYRGVPPIDLFLATGSPLIGGGDPAYRAEVDFNGTPRTTTDAGAYQYAAGGNPGWPLGQGFKTAAGSKIPRAPENLQAH